jgi:hypothetical protein
LNKLFASSFIILFLAISATVYFLRVELWPFSKFGMYSEYHVGRSKCIYTVKMRAYFPHEVVEGRPPDVEYLVGRLYGNPDLNCEALIREKGKLHRDYLKSVALTAAHALFAEKPWSDNLQKVDLIIETAHWSVWRASNVDSPDLSAVIYEETFNHAP